MERIRKYFYKDGFTLMETIERDKRNVPFSFLYYTDGNKHVRTYMACYDGEQYTNCQREQNGNVTVIFKNHDLGIGPLVCEKTFYTPTDFGMVKRCEVCKHPVILTFDAEHHCDIPITTDTCRYRGEIDHIPTNYATAILSLSREKTEQQSLCITRLSANMYYLYAVESTEPLEFEVYNAGGGLINGCITGSTTIGITSDRPRTVQYVLVPKSSNTWRFSIQVINI